MQVLTQHGSRALATWLGCWVDQRRDLFFDEGLVWPGGMAEVLMAGQGSCSAKCLLLPGLAGDSDTPHAEVGVVAHPCSLSCHTAAAAAGVAAAFWRLPAFHHAARFRQLLQLLLPGQLRLGRCPADMGHI
eukprot:365084-Chlamydomonas_euryale.AAC.22